MEKLTFFWGTPLEKLSFVLSMYLKLGAINPDLAYSEARRLIHEFNRINPNFWRE